MPSFLFLENPEHFDLNQGAEFSDFIQKSSASMGLFKPPRTAG